MIDYFAKTKTKSRVTVISLDPYPKEIQNSLIRHYKYFRILKQFREDDDMDKIAVSRFLKKTGAAKSIKELTLKIKPALSNVRISSGSTRSLLKRHCQSIKSLSVYGLECLQTDRSLDFFQPVKNLKTLHIKARKAEIRALSISKNLENVLIDLRDSQVKIDQLKSAMIRLKSLQRVELVSSAAGLSKSVELLKQLTSKDDKSLDVRITTLKGNADYNQIPEIEESLSKMVRQLNLDCITTISPLSNVLPVFYNLRKLKLEFSAADLNMMNYLKALSHMHILERLFINFAESCSKGFSTAVINNLYLPASLQEFEIEMPLSLEDYILNNLTLIKDSKRRYSWREKNYFEEETSLKAFFEVFKNAKNLKKLVFECKMLESFSTFYTNFFISILNKISNLSSFVVCARDKNIQKNIEDPPECFDLALLFDCCSRLPNLEGIEVVMPNLMFDDVDLIFDLTNLKEFHIGIADQEENDVLSFSDISNKTEKLVKILVAKAPNLKSLILDFREVITESKFCRRFLLIEQLKNLEYLFLRVKIPECNTHAVQTVGHKLQTLQKLRTIVLHFNDSDPNTYSLNTYIGYHKPIREVLFLSNEKVWLGKEYLNNDMDLQALLGE